MSQLTRRDVVEVVEEVLDRKLDEKLGIFVEHIDDKFDSLAEALSVMNTTIGSLAKQSDLNELRRDTTTIKLAVTDTNRELHSF